MRYLLTLFAIAFMAANASFVRHSLCGGECFPLHKVLHLASGVWRPPLTFVINLPILLLINDKEYEPLILRSEIIPL